MKLLSCGLLNEVNNGKAFYVHKGLFIWNYTDPLIAIMARIITNASKSYPTHTHQVRVSMHISKIKRISSPISESGSFTQLVTDGISIAQVITIHETPT